MCSQKWKPLLCKERLHRVTAAASLCRLLPSAGQPIVHPLRLYGAHLATTAHLTSPPTGQGEGTHLGRAAGKTATLLRVPDAPADFLFPTEGACTLGSVSPPPPPIKLREELATGTQAARVRVGVYMSGC